jgi:hypothetical protein
VEQEVAGRDSRIDAMRDHGHVDSEFVEQRGQEA